nr:SMR family transporter [Nakamurella aerolata]
MLAGAIALEVTATLALKALNADGVTRWGWLVPVIVGYLGAFLLLAQVLRRGMGVGTAYAIWAATGVVLTAVLGALFFGEALGWRGATGIALIAVGVALLELR